MHKQGCLLEKERMHGCCVFVNRGLPFNHAAFRRKRKKIAVENTQDLRAPAALVWIGGFLHHLPKRPVTASAVGNGFRTALTAGENYPPRCAEVTLECGYTVLKKRGRVPI